MVERSRARAFIDELAEGHLPEPKEAQELTAIEVSLEERQRQLGPLIESAAAANPALIDWELVQRLGPESLVDRARGGNPVLSPTKIADELRRIQLALERVRRERANVRSAGRVGSAAPPLTVPELWQLLQPGAHE